MPKLIAVNKSNVVTEAGKCSAVT